MRLYEIIKFDNCHAVVGYLMNMENYLKGSGPDTETINSIIETFNDPENNQQMSICFWKNEDVRQLYKKIEKYLL